MSVRGNRHVVPVGTAERPPSPERGYLTMAESDADVPRVLLFRLRGRTYHVRVLSFSEWAELLPEARPQTAIAQEGLGWVDVHSVADAASPR